MAGGGNLGLGFEVVAGDCPGAEVVVLIVLLNALPGFGFGLRLLLTFNPLSAEGEVAEVVLKKPKREEFARRAIRMFSSVRKLPDGEEGDREREVVVDVRLFVLRGGGLLEPSEVFGLGGLVEVVARPMGAGRGPEPSLGVSLMMGEY